MKDAVESLDRSHVSLPDSSSAFREEYLRELPRDKSRVGGLPSVEERPEEPTFKERQLKQQAFQCMMNKDYPGAEEAYRSLLVLQEERYGTDSKKVADSCLGLGMAFSRQGKGTDAEPFLERSVALFERHEGPQGHSVAIALRELGNNYLLEGKGEKAETALERSVDILDKPHSKDDPVLAFHLTDLAAVRTKLGKYDQAETGFQRAVKILEKENPPRSLPRALEEYAKLLDLTGRSQEAEQLRARAQGIRAKR